MVPIVRMANSMLDSVEAAEVPNCDVAPTVALVTVTEI